MTPNLRSDRIIVCFDLQTKSSLQCRRISAGGVDIPSGCLGRHLESGNSGELGRGKKFTKPVGGRKKNWGRAGGEGI